VDDGAVSFDLAVLAMAESADVGAAQAMFERCRSGNHDDGELDERVIGFYERLPPQFPCDRHMGRTPRGCRCR
jgi:hypothetical protein